MSRILRGTAAILGVVLASLAVAAAEMKEEVKIDRDHQQALKRFFGTYGFRPTRQVIREADGLRLWLPAATAAVVQTGVYSRFALAGDCEAILSYDLLTLQPPSSGYGAGVGLAFDLSDGVSRGTLQRVFKPPEGNGYVVQTNLAESGTSTKEEYRFHKAAPKRGRLALQRVKKELIFLAADSPTAPLKEIDRLPFPTGTIRAVRIFVDAGGALTPVDVRVRQIEMRAEEIVGGLPTREETGAGPWWPWGVALGVGIGLLFWWWRRRRQGEETPQTARHTPRKPERRPGRR